MHACSGTEAATPEHQVLHEDRLSSLLITCVPRVMSPAAVARHASSWCNSHVWHLRRFGLVSRAQGEALEFVELLAKGSVEGVQWRSLLRVECHIPVL